MLVAKPSDSAKISSSIDTDDFRIFTDNLVEAEGKVAKGTLLAKGKLKITQLKESSRKLATGKLAKEKLKER